MYKGIKNISAETYISAFVYGLEPGMWAIVDSKEVERMLADYPDSFELMEDKYVDELLGDGTKGTVGVVGIPFRDRSSTVNYAKAVVTETIEDAPVHDEVVEEAEAFQDESDVVHPARGRPRK